MPPDALAALWREGRMILERAGIDTAGLDARLLLLSAAGLRHETMIAEPHMQVSNDAADAYREMVARRARGEPVSRILGEREFYGRMFAVTAATLDPRPDTETLVEEALSQIAGREGPRILDLGTGTGALIVTLLAECPGASGVASDVSAEALAAARANAGRHGVLSRLRLIEADWFQGIEGRFDLIVSNPPYIPAGEIAGLSREVKEFDPHGALVGGADGLAAYRMIAAGAKAQLAAGGVVAVEIGEGQGIEVKEVFRTHGFVKASERQDLAGRMRCLAFSPA